MFKSNDFIGEAVLNLRPLIEDSELAKRPISLTKDYYKEYLNPEGLMDGLSFTEDNQSFWVNLETTELNKKTNRREKVVNGKLRIQVDVVPLKDAIDNPVGQAREEPNVNPYLPLPVGRMELSLNPLKMLNQLVGPAFRRKLYCYCCIAICLAACIFLVPALTSFIELCGFLIPG